jgi:negative regulator of flagellin synthesis FlgM
MAIDGITGKTRTPMTGTASQKAEVESAVNKASIKHAGKTDSVAITDVAQAIKKTLESSSSATLVDMERVVAVKNALADGSYHVNADKIAEKMIQHEKLMHGHGKLKK